MERRETGVHSVVIQNGSDRPVSSYQVNVTKARAWVGLFSALLGLAIMIGGMVWAGVKFGVKSEVRGQIEVECDPTGMIDDHIQQTAYEMGEEIQGVIQDDLDDLDDRMETVEHGQTSIKGSVDALRSESTRNADEIKMLLRQAIEEGDGR